MLDIKNEVFISYAREDLEIASRLYKDFKEIGLNPWFDQISLLPGQKWKIEIKKAIKNSRYFLALLSSQSVTKRGYVQKELREALDVLDEFTDEEIYLIPVRTEICQPKHEKLHELQWVDIFPSYENGYKKILAAMELPIEGLPKEEQPLIQTNYGHLQTKYSAGPDIEITCGEPGNGNRKVAFQALVDTGAAVSLIPESVIQSLNLVHGDRILVSRGDGGTISMETVYLDLYIGGLKIEMVRMIVMRSTKYGIIGRDILKDFLVILDGSKGSLQIFKTSSPKS
jgi:predicted aspartyl protease